MEKEGDIRDTLLAAPRSRDDLECVTARREGAGLQEAEECAFLRSYGSDGGRNKKHQGDGRGGEEDPAQPSFAFHHERETARSHGCKRVPPPDTRSSRA